MENPRNHNCGELSLNPLRSGLGFNERLNMAKKFLDMKDSLNPLRSGLGFNSLNFGLLKAFLFET